MLKKGDRVRVRITLSGKPIVEGIATLVAKRPYTEDSEGALWRVRFDDELSTTYDRWISESDRIDS